ncbi:MULTISPECIES: hypothetical protein [Pseudanabaena]|uniref:hypothetical protein n=1 Tax=Pseudanabaena TaxID=1152 RepID=UPI00247B0778|nr:MULTISPECIES: hypothetical protein [Pseudanabaena]MEA5487641.1 hypothetical protein [Pseudanabaena sp. CCNP1317]WGS70885.1 hypothetical protein OA858_14260 [Pseudanabaena galeata CCNP1313]
MNCFKSANIKGVNIAIATTLLMQITSMALPTTWRSVVPSAIALPGQTPDQVIDWIRTHPVLRPSAGERLLVRKSDTPSRRFQFQASVVLPGIAAIQKGDANLIRSERISFFDIINGVTRSRLEEALRSIYGPEIMRDYATAKRVYAYPTTAMVLRSQAKNASPILRALQGELRQGKKYGYWIELLQNGRGSANSGQITVFELDSLPKLEEELSKR